MMNTFEIDKANKKRVRIALLFTAVQLIGIVGVIAFANELDTIVDHNTLLALIISWILIGFTCAGKRWAAIALLVFWIFGLLQSFQLFNYFGYDAVADQMILFSLAITFIEGGLLIYLAVNAEINYSFDISKKESLENKLSKIDQNQ